MSLGDNELIIITHKWVFKFIRLLTSVDKYGNEYVKFCSKIKEVKISLWIIFLCLIKQQNIKMARSYDIG